MYFMLVLFFTVHSSLLCYFLVAWRQRLNIELRSPNFPSPLSQNSHSFSLSLCRTGSLFSLVILGDVLGDKAGKASRMRPSSF